MLFLPSTRKWFLLSLTLLALGFAVLIPDFFNDTIKRVFSILWGTLLIAFQVIGFVEWNYYKSPQGKTVPFNLWSRITSNIWLFLNAGLVLFGIIVATLDDFGDIDVFNDGARKIFFGLLGFLILALYVVAFFTWRKTRSRLEQEEALYEKETIHVSFTEAAPSPAPRSGITTHFEKKRNPPAQASRSRPVIVRKR